MRLYEFTQNPNRLYHGSNKIDAEGVKNVIRNGVKPPETVGKHQLSPILGRVYMTPDLGYAQMYAINGNLAGTDYHKDSDRVGYLFVFDRNDLSDDIVPDEDSIGEICSKLFDRKGVFRRDYAEELAAKHGVPYSNISNLAHNYRHGITDTQFRKSLDGEYAYYASSGKRLLKNKSLSQTDIQTLFALGAHWAHAGTIKPIEVWSIPLKKTSKLKKDGSNFFDHAKLRWKRKEKN